MSLSKLNVEKYRAIVFDLDDTVYMEIEYLKRAYKVISGKIIETEKIIRYSESKIYKYLLGTFIKEGRGNLFQKVAQQFKIKNFTLENFIDCLGTVSISENEIQINQPILDLIYKYHSSKDLFILTNGNVTQQKNKIKSLNIPFKDSIKVYYSSSLGSEYEKPNPDFVFKILNDNNLSKSQVLYIGDSEIDEKTAKAAVVDYIAYKELSSMNN